VWTTAEIVRVDGDPHVYLELAERDARGTLIAKARAIVWGRDVERVLDTFQAATGVRLAAGIKVLVRALPEFSVQYGLTLHIDAIDPCYTLGDLEAKKRQIRERLKTEGIFERNRQLPAPWDYRVLFAVSPPERRVTYASTPVSLAAWETRAHFARGATLPWNRYVVRIDVSDEVWATREVLRRPPPVGWDAIPEGRVSRDLGSA